MQELPRNPSNLNQLESDKFKFSLKRLPGVSFFCSEVVMPSISSVPMVKPTPFGNTFHANSKVDFGGLQLTFRVDEDLTNYKEVFNWITATGTTIDFDKHQKLIKEDPFYRNTEKNLDLIYSDGTLITLTNVMKINMNVTFVNMFPIGLGGINFNHEDSLGKPSCTIDFQYDYFKIN